MYASEVILLVEDDSSEVALIKDAIADGRILNHLFIVSSGDEALDYFEGKGKFEDRVKYPLPCLVLLDLKIPGIGGLELLRWIRESSTLARIPVIILTHSNNEADIAQAYDLGANSYLVKPFDHKAFRQMVKSINAYWLVMAERPKL
jgi:CheY-like chemotaxis protein